MSRKTHICAVFAPVFLAFIAVPASLAGPAAGPEAGLLRAVNAARVSYGLHPVHLDSALIRAARAHSREMLARNDFGHGDFRGRMTAFKVRGTFAGENLAWGTGSYAAAKTIVAEWLASPEHRANLLRPAFRRIGIGLVRGTFLGNGGASIVTADFAG